MSHFSRTAARTIRSTALTNRGRPALHHAAVASYCSTSQTRLPMIPGTPIPGLDFMKDQDPPVALERSEYPDWLGNLTQKSLAQLRRMPEEEATDKEKMRYLKLSRRQIIKEKNEAASANK